VVIGLSCRSPCQWLSPRDQPAPIRRSDDFPERHRQPQTPGGAEIDLIFLKTAAATDLSMIGIIHARGRDSKSE
jgi:hypothetical protein